MHYIVKGFMKITQIMFSPVKRSQLPLGSKQSAEGCRLVSQNQGMCLIMGFSTFSFLIKCSDKSPFLKTNFNC